MVADNTDKDHRFTDTGSYKLVERQLGVLDEQLNLARWRFLAILARRMKRGEKVDEVIQTEFPRRHPLTFLAIGILENGRTLLSAVAESQFDSGFIIARAITERTINLAFLNVCDDKEFSKWIAHSRQKSYRLLERSHSAAGMELHVRATSIPDPDAWPELKEALDQFTSTDSRREITHWTPMKLSDLVSAIEARYEQWQSMIHLLLQAISTSYALGAEAQHGTLIGTNIGQQGIKEPEELAGLLLFATSCCLVVTLMVLARLANIPDLAEEELEYFLAAGEKIIEENERNRG